MLKIEMTCKILKFPKNSNIRIKKILILEEKERKMGKNPDLKEWFKIRNEIRELKRSLN